MDQGLLNCINHVTSANDKSLSASDGHVRNLKKGVATEDGVVFQTATMNRNSFDPTHDRRNIIIIIKKN